MDLITKQEALSALYDAWNVELQTEDVPVWECAGRVLAENIYAEYSIPLKRAASISGIAVRSADFISEDTGMYTVPDTHEWRYGRDYIKVDPGIDFPDELDAVIDMKMISMLSDDGGVELSLPEGMTIRSGTNVRTKASSIMKGELLLCEGRELIAEEAALAAMSGRKTVKCIKKPMVAFIPFGNELVEPGAELKRGQMFDSNSVMIRIMLNDMGAEPVMYPPVHPETDDACEVLLEALRASDIVVYNGSLSECLDDPEATGMSGRLICSKVAASPGSDIDIAVINDRPVIGLPRKPLAALYDMDWCVHSLVCSMLGRPFPVRTRITALLKEDLHVTLPQMETCVKMNVYRVHFGYAAYPVHDDASLAEAMSANALFITQTGRALYPAGSLIDVELRYEFNE